MRDLLFFDRTFFCQIRCFYEVVDKRRLEIFRAVIAVCTQSQISSCTNLMLLVSFKTLGQSDCCCCCLLSSQQSSMKIEEALCNKSTLQASELGNISKRNLVSRHLNSYLFWCDCIAMHTHKLISPKFILPIIMSIFRTFKYR